MAIRIRTLPPPPSRAAALALLLWASLAGCAARSSGRELDPPWRAWAEREPASWSLRAGSSVHAPGSVASRLPEGRAPEIPAEAGPEDYVRLALAWSPELRAAELRVERLRERIPQATSFDDPMLEVAPFGEMAETAAGQVGVMTSIRQRLPFFGKRGARGRIAAQEVAVAVQDLEAARLAVVADARRAYWSYSYAVRALDVAHADRALLAQFQRIAEAKLVAGTASQQDVLRAMVELGALDNEIAVLEQRRTSAVAMLNRLLDRPTDAELPAPRPAEHERIALQLDRLLERAAEKNPSLRAAYERIQGFRERLTLAELARWPDVTVGFQYNPVREEGIAASADGTDQWWIGVGLNLPVWLGRLRAAEEEARAGIREGIAELTSERNRVAFRVQDALARVEAQQRLVELLEGAIVPQARQAVDASESGYRAGSVDFQALVDNWRNLLDLELLLHESLARLEQDFADLQEVAGSDLERTDAGAPAGGPR